jgi:hypothetical protein
MKDKITAICGSSNQFDLLDNISNNPNYVFENDPSYETVVLFNESGNIINVNSWIECANYVNGGWFNSSYLETNGEKYLFYITFLSFVVVVSYRYFKNANKK